MQAAGQYLAEERGAFDAEEKPVREPAPAKPATAQLYELAAAHDGQPCDAWLRLFYLWWGDMD